MSRGQSAKNRLEALVNGDAGALARAISSVERRAADGREILQVIQPHLGRARVIGFTGVPGAGKSTLISRYVGALRRAGKRVAVVAIDPSSPISGGAVLGDRIRMAEHATDEHVFVRSLASRSHPGGLAPTAMQVVDLMDAAGWDRIVIETVGTGQGEVDIADAADVRVVVCAAGLGDDVQALKAGILEIADVLVVNKSDLPGGDTTVNQLAAMLALRAEQARDVSICKTTATTAEGVAELAETIEVRLAAQSQRRTQTPQRTRRVLVAAAGNLLNRTLRERDDPWLMAICDKLQRGELDLESAAQQVLCSGRISDG
ncbi:MAG: methylmalonyl Co-A mutase-associated GTPase MeaB [Gammaproteobacteria bacterium]|nr:methylmalonyl Co-A mutase-associated GTPase MeaB [Gammaproteobacteria bacterium]MDX2462787.1 methylmalonyl Co-A mutase-associated GTPase MeaB [Gammaproteobacteria bacterium]